MVESNFPVDKVAYSYSVFWNASKLLERGASDPEKADLFSGTATRLYRLGDAALLVLCGEEIQRRSVGRRD
jgi:L-fuconolactonase